MSIASSLLAQDTLLLKKDIDIFNYKLKFPLLDSIELDTIFEFNGYLVIRLDDSSKIENSKTGKDLFLAEVYFVNSISEIISLSEVYYYYATFGSIINYEVLGFDNNFINKLTSFAKYYQIFNKANESGSKIFLYNRNGILQTNLLIDNKDIVTFNNYPDINYIIFKCKFFTSVLNFKYFNNSKKVFLPISPLNEFVQVTIDEMKNFGFIDGRLIIKEF